MLLKFGGLHVKILVKIHIGENFKILSVLPRHALHIQGSRTNYGYKALKASGPKLWNNLSDEIRSLTSLAIFKHRVKSSLLAEYCSLEKLPNLFYFSKVSIDRPSSDDIIKN